MPASKKRASKKKASTKRTSSKKTSAKRSVEKRPAVSLQGGLPKLRINFQLDDKKIADIQRCLAKGRLSVTLTRVDLASGRAGDPWLYD